jgi:hypothetical protein
MARRAMAGTINQTTVRGVVQNPAWGFSVGSSAAP